MDFSHGEDIKNEFVLGQFSFSEILRRSLYLFLFFFLVYNIKCKQGKNVLICTPPANFSKVS